MSVTGQCMQTQDVFFSLFNLWRLGALSFTFVKWISLVTWPCDRSKAIYCHIKLKFRAMMLQDLEQVWGLRICPKKAPDCLRKLIRRAFGTRPSICPKLTWVLNSFEIILNGICLTLVTILLNYFCLVNNFSFKTFF